MAATPRAMPNSGNHRDTSEARAARESVLEGPERGPLVEGHDGLLKRLTKSIIETAPDKEMTEPSQRKTREREQEDGDPRNGTCAKTAPTETWG